jgi:hypothetical protein
MANEATALKKAAVLTGLTMLVGGSEIASAGTITEGPSNFGSLNEQGLPPGTTDFLQFNKFDPTLGNLTDVTISLNSSIFEISGISFTATVDSPSGNLTGSPFMGTGAGSTGVAFNSTTNPLSSSFGLYEGAPGTKFNLDFTYNSGCEMGLSCGEGWTGSVTVTYDFTATPLPASLPLLATGLGGLGLAAWRSRRKQKPASQS